MLNECLHILIDCSQLSKTYYIVLFSSSTRDRHAWHDAYIGGRFRRTKITHKASDVAENLQLYQVVRFFHPRSSCRMMHISVKVYMWHISYISWTYICSRNAVIASFDDWWPGLLRRCSARLEQLAIQRHCVTDTRHLQVSAEDTSFRCFPYLTQLVLNLRCTVFL